jgi:hypothetical protein
MKPTVTRIMLAVLLLTALAAILAAEQPQAVLGKINFATLFDSAPAMPVSTAEASKRTYGTEPNANADTSGLDAFYVAYNKRVADSREVIKPAVEARPANQEAMAQEATAQADNSAIISRMGGTEKISQMNEQEMQQAAMQAAGSYQQSMAPQGSQTSGGMQAVMQRVMNDPAYRERFEKMTPQEQEAEMRKAMGPGAHVAEHTAAEEQRAMQAPNEVKRVMAKQNDLNGIYQKILGIDAEFVKKDQAISTAPGSHEQIMQQIQAKIAKIPMVDGGEAGPIPDPVQFRAAQVERATLNRKRAALELQQRTALYAQRKVQYKEVAGSYATWLKQNAAPVSNSTAKLMEEANAEIALHCEEELINLAEGLRKYHEQTTRDAAQHERGYQTTMSEPSPAPAK